jgi:hypothetical protein
MRALCATAALGAVLAFTPFFQRQPSLLLSIRQPEGHRPSFRSTAVNARHGLTLDYRFTCPRTVRLNVAVLRVTVGYTKIRRGDVLARFESPQAKSRTGTFAYRRAGRYRLQVSLAGVCSWSMRVFG